MVKHNILQLLIIATGTLSCLTSQISLANTTVTVIEINDFHGHLTASTKAPGMVKLSGEIKKLENTSQNPIFVSGGDNYQGGAISNLTYGTPVNKMYRHLGLVASAIGDHEFNWGTWRIPAWSKQGHFSYLATNIYNKKTNRPVKWAKPYIIVTKAGEKIAFIGVATQETSFTAFPLLVKKFTFKDDASSAQHWINYLKAGKAPQGKPDAIIALTHIPSYQNKKNQQIYGNEIKNFCAKTDGIDAIITAHSHLKVNGKLNNIPVIQAAKNGQAIGEISLTFNKHHKLINTSSQVKTFTNNINNIPSNQKAQTTYLKYDKIFKNILHNKIGYATAKFNHNLDKPIVTPLGLFICNIIKAATHTNVAIMNGSGIRSPLHKGNITIADIFNIFPFNNQIYIFKLTGKELKKVIEHGLLNPNPHIFNIQFCGIDVNYNPNRPFGNRIIKLTIQGHPLKMDKLYSVAIPDYLFYGGNQYDFRKAKNIIRTPYDLRETVIKYIKKHKHISPSLPLNTHMTTGNRQ